MCTALEKHVQHIMQHIDGTMEEKADVKEELLSHLQISKSQFIEDGYYEKEAEELAIKHFGNPDPIADDLQQAMFPYRRLFFLILGISSLLCTFCTYVLSLFLEGDAFYGWLIAAVITSSSFLLLGEQFLPRLERKSVFITILIFHTLLFVYGYFITSSIVQVLSIPLSLILLAIIFFSVFLIYRIAMYDYPFHNHELKFIHFLNITLGLFYIGFTLFLLWVSLAFFESLEAIMLVGLIPALIWLISYILQIQFIKKNKQKWAYIALVGSCFAGMFLVWSIFG